FFFFFQAEDGIRDFHVTGVQTCALPIFHGQHGQRPVDRLRGGIHGAERTRRVAFRGSCTTQTDERAEPRGAQEERSTHSPPLSRSEERRVGKECRSRWSPSHKSNTKQTE